ncbi:hypothetical protein LUZ61_006296 [Rhynchospora tenuis]|uniref:SWIM-type domain-containing protein n=1 Tax=Rhynchospora tenuis TaxID=198213 RepID=A0AAD5ZRC7_9POAL|nr:hypothetical protein LUZ61_006296 [Rhynchospora tenuis]
MAANVSGCPHSSKSQLGLSFSFPYHSQQKNFKLSLFVYFVFAFIGIFWALDSYLYALASSFLPLSTSSLVISSQLAFTAVSAFFLVRQRFTPYSFNAVVLLTIGPAVLSLGEGSDRPEGVSKGKYIFGLLMAVAAAALAGFIFAFMELAMRRGKVVQTYAASMEMQLAICISASIVLYTCAGLDLALAWDIYQFSQGETVAEDWSGSDIGDYDIEELTDQDGDPVEDVKQAFDVETTNQQPLQPVVPVPYKGMEFPTSEAGHLYYLRYAYDRGFGVLKNGGSSKDGRQRVIVLCTKGGKTKKTSKKAIPDKNKKVEKQGCPARIAGVSIASNINAVMEMGGGPLHCGFTERDGRNLIAKMRRGKFHKGDAEALMQYFREAKQKDPKFYYSYRYDLPVAPIVGVNHHGQTIIFGCAMMTHEDADTYEWIITNWLECMGGKAPLTIITDQSYAMKKAIAATLPETRHRHCIWHILDKLDNRIGNDKDAGKDLRKVIYESKTESEFESKWEFTVSHYSLQDNVWLTDMFHMRHMWVPVYLNNFFWAGMRSTQRSESINAFLDKYVNSKTTLRNFVRCFDLAMSRLRRRESDENYECIRGRSRLISQWNSIEQQFSEKYTNNMFIQFQGEIKALIDSKFTFSERLGNTKVYNVDDGEKEFKVEFNCADQTYSCECHLFETKGLVCRHALLVYKQEDVPHVPQKYIMDRWCKDFKRNYLNEGAIAVSVRERRDAHNNLHLILYPVYQRLIDYAALDEHTQHCVVEGLNGLMISIAKVTETTQSVGQNSSGIRAEGGSNEHIGTGIEDEDISVKDPLKRRKRGRPPVLRKKSTLEKKKDEAKKKWTRSQQN